MASSSSVLGSGGPQWSKWKFNEKAGNYYRGRLNASGKWEYEYALSIEPEDQSDIMFTSSARMQTTSAPRRRAHFASDTITHGEVSSSGLGDGNQYAGQEDNQDVDDENEEGGDNPYAIHQQRQSKRGNSRAGARSFDEMTSQMGRTSLSGMPHGSNNIGGLRDDDDDETESVRGKGGGIQIFAGSTGKSTLISTRPNEYGISTESSDPNYKLHPSREFKWGRVFKVLWAEPGSQDQFDSVHQVRRFIVIKRMEGHCIALPIVNYTKLKPMKHSEQKSHSLIFTSNEPPNPQEEETNLLEPIRIVPVNRRQKLDPTARLNYAKLYTIEYNVEVWFIGHLHPDSEQQLVDDYNSIHTLLPDRRKAKSRVGNSRRKDFGSVDTSAYSPISSTGARFPQQLQRGSIPERPQSFGAFPEPQNYPVAFNNHPSDQAFYQPSSFDPHQSESFGISAPPQVMSYSGSSRQQRSYQPPFNQHNASSSNYIAGSQRNYPSSSSYQPPDHEQDDDLYDED